MVYLCIFLPWVAMARSRWMVMMDKFSSSDHKRSGLARKCNHLRPIYLSTTQSCKLIMFGSVSKSTETFISNGLCKQESKSLGLGFWVLGFMVVVHAWNWTTFSLVQTKQSNMISFSSNEIVGFHSNELKDVGEHGNWWCHSRIKPQWNWHYQDSFLIRNWRSIFFLIWRQSSTISTCATKMGI